MWELAPVFGVLGGLAGIATTVPYYCLVNVATVILLRYRRGIVSPA